MDSLWLQDRRRTLFNFLADHTISLMEVKGGVYLYQGYFHWWLLECWSYYCPSDTHRQCCHDCPQDSPQQWSHAACSSHSLDFWWLYWAAEPTHSATTYLLPSLGRSTLPIYSVYKKLYWSWLLLIYFFDLDFQINPFTMLGSISPGALFPSTITLRALPRIFLILYGWADTAFTQYFSTLVVSKWDSERK